MGCNMLTFDQFLERKTTSFNWPGDCNSKTLARKAITPKCYLEPGGSHDKIKDREFGSTVTVVPRHRDINPYTCKAIIKDIEGNC